MSYAGDVTPTEAYGLLEEHSDAALIDVRTPAELTYVGMPDLSKLGKPVVTVPWHPQMAHDELAAQLVAAGISAENQLLFICRSGVRSRNAATLATQAGFTRSHNVINGFEGDLDTNGHRGTQGGWKVDGLPWRQS